MDYEKILTDAYAAATAAILARFKEGKREHPFNCGFAWVIIDGQDGLARHCRKMLKSEVAQTDQFRREYQIRYGDKGYPRGWQFWKPGDWPSAAAVGVPTIYQQDVDFMSAGAKGFADELAKHGIVATVGSRLD